MTYDGLKDNNSLMAHYTGLPDSVTFQCVVNFAKRFSVSSYSWNVSCASVEDQLLLTLIKLRHNFTHKHLAFLFSLSVAAVSNITTKWIDILHELLFVSIMKAVEIPSRHKNVLSMPQSFDKFPGSTHNSGLYGNSICCSQHVRSDGHIFTLQTA